MLRKYLILTIVFFPFFTSMAQAKSYTGSWYTIDLGTSQWKYTPVDAESDNDMFTSGNKIIQVFSPNTDVYTVIQSGNKKNIASLFRAYRDSIGSTDMTREQSRSSKNGKIYFSTFSFDTSEGQTSYGLFCIASSTKTESSTMINILNLSQAVKQSEGIKICSSLVSLPQMIHGTVAQ